MKKYLFLLILALPVLGFSQHKIVGTITTVEKSPLLGVEVYIEELNRGTSTDEFGNYEISNLPGTTLKITVSYIGFEKQTSTITLDQPVTTINFELKETVFKMDEVIISTPFNRLQSENVMKVEKATLTQLKNKGINNLSEGLASITGVSQVSTGVGIGKPVIRGLRGNRVLVYNQGIRLENQQFGDEHGLGVDEFSIESVEVIKGPASLLYGSDALGGVIYFNPVKFAESDAMEAKVDQNFFSNTSGTSTSIGVKKSYDSWKFLANGSINKHSDYKVPTGDRITNSRYNETVFNSAVGYHNTKIASTLRFNHNFSEIGIPEGMEIQSKNKTPMLPFQEIKNNLVSLNTVFFLENSKIATVFGYTQNTRKEFEDEHGHDDHDDDDHDDDDHDDHDDYEEEHAALETKLNTFSYDVKWHLPTKSDLSTIIGVQGLQQKNTNYGEELLIPDATIGDFGLLVTSSYKSDNTNILAGIRLDNRSIKTERHEIAHEDEVHVFEAIDRSFTNVSLSLGYKTELFKTISTRLNIASGFKAPNLSELTSNGIHHGTNRFEIGNSDLDSEKNLQSDLVFEYNSEHVELFANGFYNHINNYIFISPTDEFEDGAQVFNYVQDDANLYGGEFGLHFHPHPLDWLHIYSSYEFVVGKQKDGDHLPLIPAHKMEQTIRFEFKNSPKIQNAFAALRIENHFKQDKVSQFETPSKAYGLMHLNAGGTILMKEVDLRFNIGINNLFDKEYINHLSRLKVDNLYNMGRNVVIGIGIEI